MAVKEHEQGHGDISSLNGNGDDSSHNYDEKPGSDPEAGPSKISRSQADPFGDERNSEVKYRTLTWWSVSSPD